MSFQMAPRYRLTGMTEGYASTGRIEKEMVYCILKLIRGQALHKEYAEGIGERGSEVHRLVNRSDPLLLPTPYSWCSPLPCLPFVSPLPCFSLYSFIFS